MGKKWVVEEELTPRQRRMIEGLTLTNNKKRTQKGRKTYKPKDLNIVVDIDMEAWKKKVKPFKVDKGRVEPFRTDPI